MRSSACAPVPRYCARPVLCCLTCPSAPALGSTNSAAGCPALFVGFTATMAGANFSLLKIIGHGPPPSPHRTAAHACLAPPPLGTPRSPAKHVTPCPSLITHPAAPG